MDDIHQIILILSIAAFLASFALVCSKYNKKREEDFEYSKETAQKLCELQSGYIAAAPIIGGQEKRKQAFDNCMKTFNGDMPSAYVTSTFNY